MTTDKSSARCRTFYRRTHKPRENCFIVRNEAQREVIDWNKYMPTGTDYSSYITNSFTLSAECAELLALCHMFRPLQASWNVMAHAQKPHFVFRWNGRVHLNRRRASVPSTTGSRGVRISGSNAGYTMFRGSVKSTGYPLHSPVSPFTSPPMRCVPSHFNWSLPQKAGNVRDCTP